jgi:hypothetical protein
MVEIRMGKWRRTVLREPVRLLPVVEEPACDVG